MLISVHQANHTLLNKAINILSIRLSYGEEFETDITGKGMKERPVLEEFEAFPKLVFPNDTSRPINIDKLEVDTMSVVVLRQNDGALKTSIRPTPGIWVSIV